MTENEQELLAAALEIYPGTCRGGHEDTGERFRVARAAVLAERLEETMPGAWEEYEQLARAARAAAVKCNALSDVLYAIDPARVEAIDRKVIEEIPK